MLWYDLATSNNHKTTWQNPSDLTVTYSENGTTITKQEANSTWRYYWYNDPTISTVNVGNRYSIPVPFRIEFDVIAVTGSVILDLFNNVSAEHIDNCVLPVGHITLIHDGIVCKALNDDVEFYSKAMGTDNVRLGFVLNNNNESITFKNFIIYNCKR